MFRTLKSILSHFEGILGYMAGLVLLIGLVVFILGLGDAFALGFTGSLPKSISGVWSCVTLAFITGWITSCYRIERDSYYFSPWQSVIFRSSSIAMVAIFFLAVLISIADKTFLSWGIFISEIFPTAGLAAGTIALFLIIPVGAANSHDRATKALSRQLFTRYRIEGKKADGKWQLIQQFEDDTSDHFSSSRLKATLCQRKLEDEGVWVEIRQILEKGYMELLDAKSVL